MTQNVEMLENLTKGLKKHSDHLTHVMSNLQRCCIQISSPHETEQKTNYKPNVIGNQNHINVQHKRELTNTKHEQDTIEKAKHDQFANTTHQQKLTKVRPILFHMPTGKYFTQGDKKPLWILAVLAAIGSVAPIYVHGDEVGVSIEIEKLANLYIGANWKEKLHIIDTYSKTYRELTKDPQNYIEISGLYPGGGELNHNMIAVDFGDNREPSRTFQNLPITQRFVTCLLSHYRPEAKHFGSLYLPLHIEWSDAADMKRLNHFRTRVQQWAWIPISTSSKYSRSYLYTE